MSDTARRALIIGVGLTGSVLLAATIIWGVSRMGPRTVPLIEADGRPFRVRPEGLPATPPPATGRAEQPRMLPAPEAPRTDALRQQMQPPAPPVAATPAPATVTPATPMPAAARTPAARATPPAAAPPATQPAARVATLPGRASVQLTAATSEDAARAEWERLRRRVPELAAHQPRITRLDREGREPLFRLRVAGLADPAAARALCEQVRAKGAACNPV